jgi:signal peptidase I
MLSPSEQSGPRAQLITQVLGKFGSTRIRVYGSSMLPSIRPGDEIELQSAAFHEINIGKIVAFQRDGRLFVHRVTQRDSQKIIVRGDTLPCADAPVSESEFLGVVASVFRKGERVDQKNSLVQRAAARLFRRSRLCAAVFVKFASL